MTILKGISAAPGVAFGTARWIDHRVRESVRSVVQNPRHEWLRVQKAMKGVQSELLAISESSTIAETEHSRIIAANAQILADPELLQAVRDMIFGERVNGEWAIHSVFERFASTLREQEDDYLQARAKDLQALCQHVLAAMQACLADASGPLDNQAIIASQFLSFKDVAEVDKSRLQGICLVEGNRNDHALIMARLLGIPAVLGAGADLKRSVLGNQVLLDGDQGLVIVNPDAATMTRYRQRLQPLSASRQCRLIPSPARTVDGCRIDVLANVASVKTALAARDAGADGIGLLRSEFLFADRRQVPCEEEQFQAFWEIAAVFPNREVTIRLFDAGCDKPAFGLVPAVEANPALGVRGLRLAFAYPDILLKPQIKAILRLAARQRVNVLLPMVTSLQEILRCRQVLDECRHELGHVAHGRCGFGVMIEVPSAALMADQLAAEVDFFSIGSNDLIQYLYARDRTNPALGDLSEADETALLRVIHQVIRCGHRRRKRVSLCGEWGQSLPHLTALVGMGIDQVSVNPSFIPEARAMIGKLDRRQARQVVRQALKFRDGARSENK